MHMTLLCFAKLWLCYQFLWIYFMHLPFLLRVSSFHYKIVQCLRDMDETDQGPNVTLLFDNLNSWLINEKHIDKNVVKTAPQHIRTGDK